MLGGVVSAIGAFLARGDGATPLTPERAVAFPVVGVLGVLAFEIYVAYLLRGTGVPPNTSPLGQSVVTALLLLVLPAASWARRRQYGPAGLSAGPVAVAAVLALGIAVLSGSALNALALGWIAGGALVLALPVLALATYATTAPPAGEEAGS